MTNFTEVIITVQTLRCQGEWFHRCRYDDKYSIFGCEYVTLEEIYPPNGLQKLFNFCGIIFSFEKGVDCTFFGIFQLIVWGAHQNFRAQNGNIEFQADRLVPISSIYSKYMFSSIYEPLGVFLSYAKQKYPRLQNRRALFVRNCTIICKME